MRMIIPTIGTRGDVQPFIALAQGLARAGHAVTLASHPLMRTLVEDHGVTFAPMGPDIDLAREVAAIRRRSRNAALGLIKGMRFGFDMLEGSHEEIMTLCRDADLVIVPTAIAAGKNEAELLKLPYVSVSLMPWAIPWKEPGRPLFKRLLYGAVDRLIHQITTRPLNRIRRQQGLSPVGEEGFTSPILNLVPVSPVVFPPNPYWEERHRLVGYWFADAPQNWQPSADLLAFLDGGNPPILVGLGAMSLGEEDALKTARLFVEAVQQAEVRAIIQGWETALGRMKLPETIYATGSMPHSWLMPRCKGVVHHGGYGTTSAALRAGIPALVIPYVGDQYYWAQQVHNLGVGPSPIPYPKLKGELLALSLHRLAQDEEIKHMAAVLGEKVRAEDGIGLAVHYIQQTFS